MLSLRSGICTAAESTPLMVFCSLYTRMTTVQDRLFLEPSTPLLPSLRHPPLFSHVFKFHRKVLWASAVWLNITSDTCPCYRWSHASLFFLVQFSVVWVFSLSLLTLLGVRSRYFKADSNQADMQALYTACGGHEHSFQSRGE